MSTGSQRPKVFGVGFQKTGTTSLAHAWRRLGYRVTGPNGIKDPDIAVNALAMCRELLPRFDAFQDNPWATLYQELDREVPGSKFILTVRDPDKWIVSLKEHFKRPTPMREWIYGAGMPAGNEQLYVDRMLRHNEEVQAYFADRPDDFLLMDVIGGDGWEKLCPFLGHEIPDEPFPHANKGAVRERRRQRLRQQQQQGT